MLLVDKPAGPTSHDVVARVRRLAGTRKVGHAGTLDPAATGLLLLGIGPATRLLTYLVGLDKEYSATVRLGQATSTDDAEGTPLGEPAAAAGLSDAQLTQAIASLTGPLLQVPSAVSAIKVDGRRAHERVRAGEEVLLAARPVTIRSFQLNSRLESQGEDGLFTDLNVTVVCSSGTYVRALARDLGARLGVGGHVTQLRRTAVGPFRVESAGTLDQVAADGVPNWLRPSSEVASALFPVLQLTEQQAVDLGHGKKLVTEEPDGGPLAALGPDGRLLGLVRSVAGSVTVLANFPSPQGQATLPAERASE